MSEIQPNPETADAGRRDLGHIMVLAVMEVAQERGGIEFMDNLMTLLPQELTAEHGYQPSRALLNTLDRVYPGAVEQVLTRTNELFEEYAELVVADNYRQD